MRRTIALFVMTALLGMLVMAPAAVAQRNQPPLVRGELTLYPRWDPDPDCATPRFLSTEQAEADNSCAFIFQAAQEVLVALGMDPLTMEWPATDGLPFRLDATRDIEGHFVVRGFGGAQARLEVDLRGTSGRQTMSIASDTSDDYTLVTGTTEIHFDLETDRALNRRNFSGLTLETTVRGVQAVAWIDLTASYITIPVWVRRR